MGFIAILGRCGFYFGLLRGFGGCFGASDACFKLLVKLGFGAVFWVFGVVMCSEVNFLVDLVRFWAWWIRC